MNRKWAWISGIAVVVIILTVLMFQREFGNKLESTTDSTIDGNFVVILLDGSNKPSRYWVLQNDSVDLKDGWVAFDEKDSQTIHLHGNVIVKEFDTDQELANIKKEYELK